MLDLQYFDNKSQVTNRYWWVKSNVNGEFHLELVIVCHIKFGIKISST